MARPTLGPSAAGGSSAAEKAAIAVAHKILVAVFNILQHGAVFADLGGDCVDRVKKHSTAKRLVRCLDALDNNIMLQPKATARPPSIIRPLPQTHLLRFSGRSDSPIHLWKARESV